MLGVIGALLGGSEKFILLRESLVTSVIGLCYLTSLLFPKPLILVFARDFVHGATSYQHISQSKYRHVFRLVTFIWGIVLTTEAAIKATLVFKLPTAAFLLVSPLLTYGSIGLTTGWTAWFFQNFKKNLANK